MINIAIIGCGKHMQNFHLPSLKRLKKKINIVGIYDPDFKKAQKISKKNNITKVYKNLDSLFLDKEIEVVDICSPASLHYQQIVKSIKNNKHVMVEKPFVIKNVEMNEIIKISKNKKLKIMCLQHQRFRNETIALKKFLNKNKKKLGNLYMIKSYANYFNGIPTQTKNSFTDKKLSGGGPIIDHGSHIFDLILYLLNFPKIKNVNSYIFYNKIKKNIKYNVEDAGLISILFKNNLLVNFETSYLSNEKRDLFKIKFFFKKGFVEWPELNYNFRNQPNKTLTIHCSKVKNASDNEFEHFVNCVKYNKKMLISLKQTKEIVNLVNMVYSNNKILQNRQTL